MSQQKRNPDIDFGFHATIPRAIRTHYKTLTPMQKWLYVCLKDLCGEHGTCYRTVKVLSAETDISTGMISESIPHLHTAGLIHAEKKKRKEGGKEVWHITIVDIWPANGKLHPTKRSHSEQQRSPDEQTTENVHTVNENVHSVNDQGTKRSPAEQERSLCETEEGSGEAVSSFEEGSGEAVGTYGANAPTPAHLKEIVDEKLEKVEEELERITGEHPAVKLTDTESHYHIAGSAIGNDALFADPEDDDFDADEHERVVINAFLEEEPVLAAPRLILPSKIGATRYADMATSHDHSRADAHSSIRPDYHNQQNHQDHDPNERATARDDTTSSPGTLPPSARMTPSQQAPGALTGVQAQPLSAPTPAQAEFPPAGSVARPQAPTAQTKGFTPPKRPPAKRPPAMPEPPKEITLTPQEQAFWGLWCNLFFNKDIAPDLTLTAYGHVRKLAPHITSAEQMESLVKRARKDLEDNTGVKRKTVYLGNCVNSYPGWKQEQTAQAPPQDWVPDETDYSTKAQLWRQEHTTRSGK